ncbi:unnamed protein product [Caenorhabditis auriculariae]|uniref:Uncharacterized protein n=1 Tax=Caenorhabditis auriculariae TaxID=2777116 RepID=A0A8S1GYK8_9PELO|nr:unnamed protein product [Caenorhabditis auriculariae]
MKSTSFPKWLPIEIKEFYLENGVKNLFKWQRNIIDQSSESQQNILFSAPTSAGKSIVAEFLALRVAQEGRKVLFILPYISVAKEKLFHLQKCWRRVDITVAGFIGPNSVPPNDWLAAVCTIEKAASLLNRALTDAWCDKIGMVVVDELHMLFDSSRGVNLEFLLCKILYWNRTAAVNPIRVVGMSATVPQIKSLGEWMNSKVFRAEFRPIDLKENVVYNDIVYNSEGEVFGEEIRRLESSRDVSLTLALEGCRRGKKQLLFCSSKADTEKTSLDLAKLLDPLLKSSPILKDVMEKIREGLMAAKKRLDQLGSTDKCLLLSLARGIAFHHAGLTIEERECIEETFRNGHLLVLVCTSTLASGVNLPAETVIIKAQSRGPSALNSTTYRQMIGRAGRMGHSTEDFRIQLIIKECRKMFFLLLKSRTEKHGNRGQRTFKGRWPKDLEASNNHLS